VEGLTTDEVAQKIKEGLEKDYFQKATVAVTIESALAGGSSARRDLRDRKREPARPLLLPRTNSLQ